MEPVTTALLGVFLWEGFGQPLLAKAKDKYAEKVFEKTDNLVSKLPFRKEENEIIEAEIIEAVKKEEIINQETFVQFIEHSSNFNKALENLKEVKQDVEIINSFKSLSNTKIKIKGENKSIKDSFENINDSEIEI